MFSLPLLKEMPNANPFREANRIYKLPFAVPIKLVTSWGLEVSLIFQAGRWVLDLHQRWLEQRQRVLFPCPQAAAGRQAVLPAQNMGSPPCLAWSQLGSEEDQTVPASGVDLLEVAGGACGALGGTPVPSPGSAVTRAAMVCGNILGECPHGYWD